MAIQAFVVTPFCCLVSYSQPFLPVFVHFILRSYVSKSFSFSLDFRSFKFHPLLWEPGGPMQLVLMTSCLASLFWHLSFCLPQCIKKCLFIPHDIFYTYHFLHLKDTAPKTKDVADRLGNHLMVVQKTKGMEFCLLARGGVGGNGRKIWGLSRLGSSSGAGAKPQDRRLLTLAQF